MIYEVHHDQGGVLGLITASSRDAAFEKAEEKYSWAKGNLHVRLSPRNDIRSYPHNN